MTEWVLGKVVLPTVIHPPIAPLFHGPAGEPVITVVRDVLQEKDAEIAYLKKRIKELEEALEALQAMEPFVTVRCGMVLGEIPGRVKFPSGPDETP